MLFFGENIFYSIILNIYIQNMSGTIDSIDFLRRVSPSVLDEQQFHCEQYSSENWYIYQAIHFQQHLAQSHQYKLRMNQKNND